MARTASRRSKPQSTSSWKTHVGSSAFRPTNIWVFPERADLGPFAGAPFAAGQVGAIAHQSRRHQPDRHPRERIIVGNSDKTSAQFPHPRRSYLMELSLASGERLLRDPGRRLAEADLRLEGREVIVGLGRIFVEHARP